MESQNEHYLIKEAAVADFVQDFQDDVRAGGARPLSDYLRRYPEAEDEVAKEFLELSKPDSEEGAGGESQSSEAPNREVRDGEATVIGGRYRIVELLGRGGQGTVFLAYDERVRRRVALKMLDGRFLSSTQRMRLQREATAIAAVDDPGIAEVLDARFDGDTPYLAIRYIDGHNLADVLAGRSTVEELITPPTETATIRNVVEFFAGAARSIEAAHRAGFVHRDIKPANLMVHSGGRAVVLDFGLALRTDETEEALTRTGEGVGTPEYMAPEQISARVGPVGPRTDVYGLGATLFEALAGERPFQGTTLHDLEQLILKEPRRPLTELNSALSRDLDVVVQTAMDIDPSRRYASAAAMAEDLQRVLDSKPILARPSSVFLRLHRWTRRQPALATALAALFFVLIAGLVASLIALDRRGELIYDKNAALDFANSQLLVRRSGETLDVNPGEALAMARAAFTLSPGRQSRSALYAPLERTRILAQVKTGKLSTAPTAAFAPGGDVVVGVRSQREEDGGTGYWLWRWRCAEGEEIEVGPRTGTSKSVRLCPLSSDGLDVVVVDEAGTVTRFDGDDKLWTTQIPPGTYAPTFQRSDDAVWLAGSELTGRIALESGAWTESSGAQSRAASWTMSAPPGDGDLTARVMHGDSGETREFPITEARKTIASVSPSGRRFAAAMVQPGRVRAWDIESGDVLVDEPGNFRATSLAWSDDSTRLLMVSYPSMVVVFRTAPPPELIRLSGTTAPAAACWFHSDAGAASILRRDGTLETWRTLPSPPTGALHPAPAAAPTATQALAGPVTRCDVSSDRDAMAVARPGGELSLYRLAPGLDAVELGSMRLPKEAMSLCVISGESPMVAAVDATGTVCLWSPGLSEPLLPLGGVVGTALATSSDGRTLFVGDNEGLIHVVEDGAVVHRLTPVFGDGKKTRPVLDLVPSPDGSAIAAGYLPFLLHIWSGPDFIGPPREYARGNFTRLTWRPDSSGLVLHKPSVGGSFFSVDALTGDPHHPVLGKTVGAASIVFPGGGKPFVAACADGSAIVCDGEAQPLADFPLHDAPLAMASASPVPDDPRVLTVDEKGAAFIWTVSPEATADRYSPLDPSASIWASLGLDSENSPRQR